MEDLLGFLLILALPPAWIFAGFFFESSFSEKAKRERKEREEWRTVARALAEENNRLRAEAASRGIYR